MLKQIVLRLNPIWTRWAAKPYSGGLAGKALLDEVQYLQERVAQLAQVGVWKRAKFAVQPPVINSLDLIDQYIRGMLKPGDSFWHSYTNRIVEPGDLCRQRADNSGWVGAVQSVCLDDNNRAYFSWLRAKPGIQISHVEMAVLRPHKSAGRSSRSSVS